jgi:predicted HicB family RNase H-like nuclease
MTKRIIDGVTYNTDTSTLIAQSEYEVDYKRERAECFGQLYQTRGGAFFVHERIDTEAEYDGDRYHDRFEPMTTAEAEKWILTGETEVFVNPFAEPPEAQAEAEPAATLYLRLPATLKARVEEAAEEAKLSLNAWAMKALENSLNAARPVEA